jgi:hypothetical protein
MKSLTKSLARVFCSGILAAATSSALAEMPGDTGAAPTGADSSATAQSAPMPQMSQGEYTGGQAVTRAEVRHELDLAIKYGVANSEVALDHWLDADVNKREQAFEAAVAAEHHY